MLLVPLFCWTPGQWGQVRRDQQVQVSAREVEEEEEEVLPHLPQVDEEEEVEEEETSRSPEMRISVSKKFKCSYLTFNQFYIKSYHFQAPTFFNHGYGDGRIAPKFCFLKH